ncbi:MAG TPA: hypothetical protein DCW90_06450 [Lachnospiraceae bacterium]|nr:hypothetical protein [uncultured Lachnoclostridium sp.]HAU85139.1 hypothetical protein [Lachnospiraceae bacterium]
MKRIKATSIESYQIVKETLDRRYDICIRGLKELKEATANELALYLFEIGEAPMFNRQFVHPRLTELVDMKIIKIVGKKKDAISNRNCLLYSLA